MRMDLAAGALSGFGIGSAMGWLGTGSLVSGVGMGLLLGAGVFVVLASFERER